MFLRTGISGRTQPKTSVPSAVIFEPPPQPTPCRAEQRAERRQPREDGQRRHHGQRLPSARSVLAPITALIEERDGLRHQLGNAQRQGMRTCARTSSKTARLRPGAHLDNVDLLQELRQERARRGRDEPEAKEAKRPRLKPETTRPPQRTPRQRKKPETTRPPSSRPRCESCRLPAGCARAPNRHVVLRTDSKTQPTVSSAHPLAPTPHTTCTATCESRSISRYPLTSPPPLLLPHTRLAQLLANLTRFSAPHTTLTHTHDLITRNNIGLSRRAHSLQDTRTHTRMSRLPAGARKKPSKQSFVEKGQSLQSFGVLP